MQWVMNMMKFLRNNSTYLNLLILTMIIGILSFISEGYTLYLLMDSINDTMSISDIFDFINGNWLDGMFVKYDGDLIFKNQEVSINIGPIISILLINYILTIIILFVTFLIYFIKSNNEMHDNHLKDSASYASVIRDQHAQFLAENISHEISTPISVIESYVKISLNDTVSCIYNKKSKCSKTEKYCNYMIEIQKNTEVIKSILNRLSKYKTVKYGKNVSLYELFEFCRNSLSISKIYNFKITIDESLTKYTPSSICSTDLISTITNMMKNSVEAGATEIIISGEFHQCTKSEDSYIILSFIDNGSGIQNKNGEILNKRDYDTIFKPYFSVKNKLNKVTNLISSNNGVLSASRGIGLFFTKSIIEEHGGWIKVVYTNANDGTIFSLKLYVDEINLDEKQEI